MKIQSKPILFLILAGLAVIAISAVIAIRIDVKNRHAREAREALEQREAAARKFSQGVEGFTDHMKLPTGPTTWGDPTPAKKESAKAE